jgi:hypothetical protein
LHENLNILEWGRSTGSILVQQNSELLYFSIAIRAFSKEDFMNFL